MPYAMTRVRCAAAAAAAATRLYVRASYDAKGAHESLAFDDRGDAFAPAPRERSCLCCNVAETDLVVILVTTVDVTAPGGNSSAKSVAASSSFAPITEEPFAIVASPPVGSADLGWGGANSQ